MIILQHISTHWTKASRGMPLAAKRNGVPKKLPVPYIACPEKGLIIHETRFYEFLDFAPKPSQLHSSSTYAKYWDITFQEKNDSVAVLFGYPEYRTGKPNRSGREHLLFTLALNQVGVLYVNGRFSDEDTWYEQHSINIAHVKRHDERVFLTKPPTFLLNQLENLL